MLKNVGYLTSKLIGVAEMKSRIIDITCKTRENVMELFEMLKNVSAIYKLRLYESENVHIILGWVPIPMENQKIQEEIEKQFGKVIKVTAKKYKDGLLSGVRIVTMAKNIVASNPLPSYLSIDGNELYVTYPGQTATCRYCGEIGHVQSNCTKRMKDFPLLGNRTNSTPEGSIDVAGRKNLPAHCTAPQKYENATLYPHCTAMVNYTTDHENSMRNICHRESSIVILFQRGSVCSTVPVSNLKICCTI